MSEANQKDQHKRQLAVQNGLGLHARAAARIAATVQQFDCQVLICKDGNEADGASVLSLLTLDAPLGTHLEILAHGSQAGEALDALETLFEERFGEEK